jgi:hypothetical protein
MIYLTVNRPPEQINDLNSNTENRFISQQNVTANKTHWIFLSTTKNHNFP